jgi:hypothetical protein
MKRYTFGKNNGRDPFAIKDKNETKWYLITKEGDQLNGRDDGKRYINKLPDFWYGQVEYNHKEMITKPGYKDIL